MKKYKIIYVIIYLLLLVLVFTKGINIGIEGNSYDDYRDKGIIDGFSGSSMFLIYNFIIVITELEKQFMKIQIGEINL